MSSGGCLTQFTEDRRYLRIAQREEDFAVTVILRLISPSTRPRPLSVVVRVENFVHFPVTIASLAACLVRLIRCAVNRHGLPSQKRSRSRCRIGRTGNECLVYTEFQIHNTRCACHVRSRLVSEVLIERNEAEFDKNLKRLATARPEKLVKDDENPPG